MQKITSTFIPQIRSTSNENQQHQTFEGAQENVGQNKSKQSDDHQVSEKYLKETIENVDHLLPDHYSVKYKYHEKTESYYVQVVDDNNDEVIREIPSEKLLDTYADMMDHLGLLVNTKA